MDFKKKVLSVIEADPDCDWDAIVNHRNTMACYKFNSAAWSALNKNGIEALLVCNYYPKTTVNVSNYYVLARDKDSGQVMLVDAWANNVFEGMREPFVVSMQEARKVSPTVLNMKWETNAWELDHIVISPYNANIPKTQKDRDAFRKKWGEFGKSLVFDAPTRSTEDPKGDSVLNMPLSPTGYVMTLSDMNRIAANRNLPNNFFALGRDFEEHVPLKKRSIEEQRSELIKAVTNGNVEKTSELLSPDNPKRGELVNTRDRDDIGSPTVLQIAARRGHSEVAWLLVEAGADIYATDTLDGRTAMHDAGKSTVKYAKDEAEKEENGKAAIVRMLAEKDRELKGGKASLINQQDDQGNAPAHIAAESGNFPAGLAMVEMGADVRNIRRKRDGKNVTELAQAMKNRSDNGERTAMMFDYASQTLSGGDLPVLGRFKAGLEQRLSENAAATAGNWHR